MGPFVVEKPNEMDVAFFFIVDCLLEYKSFVAVVFGIFFLFISDNDFISVIICLYFSFPFQLLGLAVLFIGVWVRSDPNFWEFQDNLPLGNYYGACYLCIYSGALILIVGFMGCVGTFIDSPCILWTVRNEISTRLFRLIII